MVGRIYEPDWRMSRGSSFGLPSFFSPYFCRRQGSLSKPGVFQILAPLSVSIEDFDSIDCWHDGVS